MLAKYKFTLLIITGVLIYFTTTNYNWLFVLIPVLIFNLMIWYDIYSSYKFARTHNMGNNEPQYRNFISYIYWCESIDNMNIMEEIDLKRKGVVFPKTFLIIEKIFNRLIFFVPIITILNWSAAFIGISWLIYLGDWKFALQGLGLGLVGHNIIGFFLMIIFSIISKINKILKIDSIFESSFLNFLTNSTMILWAICSICISLVNGLDIDSINEKTIPCVLISWFIAIAPWKKIASFHENEVQQKVLLFNHSLYSIAFLFYLSSLFAFNEILITLSLISFIILLFIFPIILNYEKDNGY